MSQSRNGMTQGQLGGCTVTYTLSEKDMAMVPSNIANNQDMLNEFARRSLIWNCGLIAQASGQSDLAYVDLAISETVNSFTNAANDLPDAIRDEMQGVMGVDEGQAFEPIYSALNVASDTLIDAASTLNDTWNLDSKTSTASQALDNLEDKADTMLELLNRNNPSSIYAHLDDVKDEMGADDSPVVKAMDDAFEDRIQPLEALIIEISNYIKEQKGQSDAEANSTVKGGVFEDNVHIAVKQWVETLGGNATHTGPDNLPGDHVLEVPMPDDVPMRIVVESKDESTPRGTKWIGDRLLKAMTERDCDTALWVSKTQDGLSTTQIGSLGHGSNNLGDWSAATFDNLRTALTYLHAMEVINRAKSSDIEADIDLNVLNSHCLTIRDTLKMSQTINTKIGQAETALSGAKTGIVDMRNKVSDSVTEIQSIIKVALSSGGADN
ncbi:MAG: hypothetical protein CL440_08785 [Acidimicrobiaceae bacterium]|nr:hypothetical protein [Acidimicrobiaceae bacterium]